MELEFNREILQSYHIAVQTAVCQEETLESIVPDACPDILSILDVSGQAFLTGKQARKGLAEAEGTIRAVILYRPDSGTGLRKMEVTLPFRCQAEAPELTERGIVCAAPRLRAAEARALSGARWFRMPSEFPCALPKAATPRLARPCLRALRQA